MNFCSAVWHIMVSMVCTISLFTIQSFNSSCRFCLQILEWKKHWNWHRMQIEGAWQRNSTRRCTIKSSSKQHSSVSQVANLVKLKSFLTVAVLIQEKWSHYFRVLCHNLQRLLGPFHLCIALLMSAICFVVMKGNLMKQNSSCVISWRTCMRRHFNIHWYGS